MIIPPHQEADVMSGFGQPAAVITPYGACAYYSYTPRLFHGNILPEKHVYIEIQHPFLIQ